MAANDPASTWTAFLRQFRFCFTAPGYVFFEQLATAWVMCPGRHTVTRLWRVIPAATRRPYGAYARMIREGSWSVDDLWCALVRLLVAHWAPDGTLTVVLDDTLIKKTGRKIVGAGYFRDAVHSTATYTVTAWGLNVIIIGLRIAPPWGGEPLALPVLIRVRRKDKDEKKEETELNLVELAAAMIMDVHDWLPGRQLRVVADGAYASLVGYRWPDGIHIVTRLRRDAALYDLPPPSPAPGTRRSRGRPRLRGQRLPRPEKLTAALHPNDWVAATISQRGKQVERLLYARSLLWYRVAGTRPLLLVIVRDPEGHEPDDYFVTTEIAAMPGDIAVAYADRWPIEDTHRNVKQYLGAEHPQCWVREGPERVVSLACWLYAACWHWLLVRDPDQPIWPDRPWYRSKSTPSFADALSALRAQWWSGIYGRSGREDDRDEIVKTLISVLAEAA